jgi:hypothetical protein
VYYFVLGADGQRYGPADVDTLVRWAAEGRIVASTWLVERGTDRQVPADALPAVSAALRRAAGQPASVAVERDDARSDAPTVTQPPAVTPMMPSPGAPAGTPPTPGPAAGPGLPPVPPVPAAMPGQPGALQGCPQTYRYAGAGRVGPKSKVAAGLLGIFLGGFGVHRFYLGFTGMGIVQIIVTLVTCGAGSLWGFVEGIICLTGGMRDADGMELRD